MGKNEAIEKIKKKYLEEYKRINKKGERISFFKNLIKNLKKITWMPMPNVFVVTWNGLKIILKKL